MATKRKATTKQKAEAPKAERPAARRRPTIRRAKLTEAQRLQAQAKGRSTTYNEEGRLVHLPLDPIAVRAAAVRAILKLISDSKLPFEFTREFRVPDAAAKHFTKGMPPAYCYAAMVLRGEDPWSVETATDEGMLATFGRFVWLAMGAQSDSWGNAYVNEDA